MQITRTIFTLVVAFAGLSHAAIVKRQAESIYNLPIDPAYSVPEAKLQAAINCPNGNSSPGTILIVPGTGGLPLETFDGNFGELFRVNNLPYCYLMTPNLSLGDAQVTAEYVVYASNYLAQSTGGPIRVLSHSQGGLNVQWALTFFPSTRSSIGNFVALAPDYRGTIIGPLITAAQTLTIGGGKAQASVLQQGTGSNHLKALAAAPGGLSQWVPTTNIYTIMDDIVLPEIGPGTTSVLSGANNIPLQGVCVAKVVEHFTILLDPVTMFYTLRAFLGGSDLTLLQKTKICLDGTLPRFTSVNAVTDFTTALLVAATTAVGPFGMETYVSEEPAVKAYAQ